MDVLTGRSSRRNVENVAKDDPKQKPICGTCMGAGGEWIDQNGDSKKQSKWVPCRTCAGTGRA